MSGKHDRRLAGGFSLMELIIVVAITMVVAAIAIPRVMTATQNFKLRSTASSLSGLVQKCRMLAVARNATCPTGMTCTQTGYYAVKNAPSGGINYLFVDMDGSSTINSSSEATNVLVPPTITLDTTGGGLSLSSMSLSYTPVVGTAPVIVAFNGRGLPCIIQSSGACTVTGQGYIYYLRLDRSIGATGWAAVTVSPAGRAQVWTWDGSNWE